jgi:hypothetical protein
MRPPRVPQRSWRSTSSGSISQTAVRPSAPRAGEIEWVHWGTGTAHLLPRMLRLRDGTSRTSGPLFLSERKPPPARLPPPRDVCPHTGRVRLGYDRARVLLARYTSWRLPAASLRCHPPGREEGAAAADHGQDPAPVAQKRDALRQPRPRRRRRGHRATRPSAAPVNPRCAGRVDVPTQSLLLRDRGARVQRVARPASAAHPTQKRQCPP